MQLDKTFEHTDKRMSNTIESLTKEFSGLRAGRASPNLLESIQVEAYDTRQPLNQLASVNVLDARTLTVQVWDLSVVKNVEKAIRDSGNGLNPAAEGAVIRVPLPELSSERRQELAKTAGKKAEAARIAIRNIRHESLKAVKDSALPEDETKKKLNELQKITDSWIGKIDTMLKEKEKEILKI